MPTAQVPRWLIGNTSIANEVFVVHTHSPRFVARMRYEEEFEELPRPVIAVSGGWLAVPVEWTDAFDRTTWNAEEMEESLSIAWRRFERDNS